MKTIVIPADETIREGQEVVTASRVLTEGEEVQFARGYKGQRGKPIATGRVVMNMKDDPNAPITQTTGDKKASPWRYLWKVRIERIKR